MKLPLIRRDQHNQMHVSKKTVEAFMERNKKLTIILSLLLSQRQLTECKSFMCI
ncbi:MAG: hypothetical protein IKZ48_00200 [Prevotella sp.]|nr:hypothetical protein [Prevotella sp.]